LNKFKQYSLIISGFAIGQGSMFLAQTWLVTQERFELLAAVGIGLGMLSLLQWAADCGGIYLLPRQMSEANDFQSKFWAFVFARLIFSSLFIIIIVLILSLIDVNHITYNIVIYGSLTSFIWSFNISGLLDSKKLNQIAGPLSGLCWVFASLPVFFLSDSKYFAELLGVSYSLGLLLTVFIQYFSLRNSILDLKFTSFSLALVKEQIIKGSTYNGAYITSQAYGRTIPILVDKLIDSYFAGIYVYAKNIANTASQFIEFSRRVEFSSIVNLVRSNKFDVFSILSRQKLSFAIVGSFVIVVTLSFLVLNYYGNADHLLIAEVTLILVAILFLWTISSSLGQALVALEKTGYYALTITSTLLLSIIFISSSIENIGLTGIYIGEGSMFIIQSILYVSYLKKNAVQKNYE